LFYICVYQLVKSRQDKTRQNTQKNKNTQTVTKMSSDEEVAVCLWYTLQELEKKQKKKLWVHPLNQKRITHNVIFSLLCELRADKSKFKNYNTI